jgi:hypothetical protein
MTVIYLQGLLQKLNVTVPNLKFMIAETCTGPITNWRLHEGSSSWIDGNALALFTGKISAYQITSYCFVGGSFIRFLVAGGWREVAVQGNAAG